MLKKTVHRPNHRERAQPREREKWGILEKHKDYSLRAHDFQEKKKRLQILRQKAAERNPDEFRHEMLSSRSKQGRKIAERGNPVLSHETVQLLKTQDSGYLRTMLQKTRRTLEKLEQEIILREGQGADILGGSENSGKGEHIVFVDTKTEQRQYTLDKSGDVRSNHRNSLGGPDFIQGQGKNNEFSDDKPAVLQKAQNSRRSSQRQEEASKQDRLLRKQHEKEQNTRAAKLIALRAREKSLTDAEHELELQRAKISNSVGGVTKAGVKWRPRERKR